MRWSVLILVLLMMIDVWYRAHTFGPDVRAATGMNLWPMTVGEGEPLDCDEAAYAYIGHRILQGDVMYRDLTENKPPLGYWLYTMGVAIGGYRELAIRLMPIPFILTTIAVVWWIAMRLGGPGSASLAAGLYVLLSTDPFLFGNGSNFEHFINLFTAFSLGLLIAGWNRESRWWIFGAGVCLGAAALVKQVAIVHAMVFVPALLLRARFRDPDRPRRWVRGLVDVLVLGLGIASIAAVAASIVLAGGAGRPAFDDIVHYGGALATDTLPEPNAPSRIVRWLTGNADPRGRLPWPFGTTDYLVWWGSGSWPLWLASIPALAYLVFGKPTDARQLLAAGWTGAAWLQVALPGLYWPHYYLLPIPGVVIAIAVTLADGASHLARVFRSNGRSRLRPATERSGDGAPSYKSARRSDSTVRGIFWPACATLALVAAIGGTLYIQVRDYLGVAPEQLTIRYKGGRQWVALRAIGRDLARRATIWGRPHLYVWGWQSPLNFYGRMDSPTRHFFVDNLLRDQADRGHPLIAPRTDEIMATLRRRPPELIFAGYAPFKALRDFLNESYLPSQRVFHDGRTALGLWIRRDSYGKFEMAGSRAARPDSADRPPDDRGGRLFVDESLVAIPEAVHDRVPTLAQRVMARRLPHPAPLVRPVDHRQEGLGHALGWFGWLDQDARRPGLDGSADPPGAERDHRQSRGHRLEHDVPERLGQAGEREEIRGRVVVGQVSSLAIAHEPGERPDPALQSVPQRAVADQQDADLGVPGCDDRQRIREVIDVLLGRDAAHVADHRILRRPAQRAADLEPPGPVRPEQRAIHATLPQDQPLETEPLQLADRRLRRDIRLPRAIVKPSEVTPDQPACPADPVMAGVLVEIGMEARDDVQPAPHRVAQDAQAERRLGRDVDHVGAERRDRPMGGSERRQREVELLVERQDDRSDRVRATVDLVRRPIVRMDHLDRVAAPAQVPDQLPQCPRDTIDLGKVGLRDECDAHIRPSVGTSMPAGPGLFPGEQPAPPEARSTGRASGRHRRPHDATRPVAELLENLARSPSPEDPYPSCRVGRDVRNSGLARIDPSRTLNLARRP